MDYCEQLLRYILKKDVAVEFCQGFSAQTPKTIVSGTLEWAKPDISTLQIKLKLSEKNFPLVSLFNWSLQDFRCDRLGGESRQLPGSSVLPSLSGCIPDFP